MDEEGEQKPNVIKKKNKKRIQVVTKNEKLFMPFTPPTSPSRRGGKM